MPAGPVLFHSSGLFCLSGFRSKLTGLCFCLNGIRSKLTGSCFCFSRLSFELTCLCSASVGYVKKSLRYLCFCFSKLRSKLTYCFCLSGLHSKLTYSCFCLSMLHCTFLSDLFYVSFSVGYVLKSLIIPHAMSCGRYNVFYPSVIHSVSQSFSPVFLLAQLTPLKPLNRIWWNFVVMKDIICRYAYPQEILNQFFSRSNACFELINLAKLKDTTQNSLSAQLLWNGSTVFRETL